MLNTRDIRRWAWGQIGALKPFFLSKSPHFHFITSHYFWIIGLTLTGSVLIYAIGNHANIAYVDALFFASGANTQAGLNTVDVNRLSTFQQVVIFLCMGLANPIAINTMVVFLRLYWFQKRFQHVVHEAKNKRVSIAKSRSTSGADNEPDVLERGVNGRNITVMHQSKKPRIANDGNLLSDQPAAPRTPRRSSSDDALEDDAKNHLNHDDVSMSHVHPTTIAFADTIKRSDGLEENNVKLPTAFSAEDHIKALQRQRNTQDHEVLRIPNPRDVERGVKPKVVNKDEEPDPEDEEDQHHRRSASTESPHRPPLSIRSTRSGADSRNLDGVTHQQTITIAEPERRKRDDFREDAEAITNTIFSPLRLRKLHRKGKSAENEKSPESPPWKIRRKKTMEVLKTALSRDKQMEEAPYLSWEPTMGRNSQFVGLSEVQRDELGGIEYRSLKTLALILLFYFWGFSLLFLTLLLPYILHKDEYGTVVEADGVSRTWWAFFTAQSAFHNVGFTLTPDSMVSFSTSIYVLLIASFFILIGNTAFPIMLRVIIWVCSKLVPRGSGLWEELRFLLDHPRRCFTLLFPHDATMWLLWVLVLLNGIDLFFFIVLDLPGNTLNNMPINLRFLNGWFVATCTRTAGLSSVSLSSLHPAIQVSYMIMMYISVFPIAISVRRTNVYEEKSLGVYESHGPEEEAPKSYIGAHLRRQLSFDLWYLFLGFFALAICEGSRLQNNDPDFSMWALLFECVSAYGTVGLSLGYTNFNPSLSGQFNTLGKLVIVALQIRGRHRGLPYGLDKAILLPSESLNRKEDLEDPALHLNRTTSHATGFQSLRSASLARGRTRSVERPPAGSLLTRVMQPGPAIIHNAFELAPTLSQKDLHQIHDNGQDVGHRRRRSQADPVTDGEDDNPNSRSFLFRRREALPTVASLPDFKSRSGSGSEPMSPGTAASANVNTAATAEGKNSTVKDGRRGSLPSEAAMPTGVPAGAVASAVAIANGAVTVPVAGAGSDDVVVRMPSRSNDPATKAAAAKRPSTSNKSTPLGTSNLLTEATSDLTVPGTSDNVTAHPSASNAQQHVASNEAIRQPSTTNEAESKPPRRQSAPTENMP